MSISVLSWNILGPATRDVVEYGFIPGDYGRLGKHLEIISNLDADILCFQEIDLTTLHFFNNFLLSQHAQVAYHEKGAHGGVVVYVKKSKFDFVSSVGSLLKSNHKKSPGAFCGGVIKSISTSEEFFIASVHLSKSSSSQAVLEAEYQISDLCNYVGKNLPEKIILAGDFNTMYEDMQQGVLETISKKLNKKFLIFEHESCTFHAPSSQPFSIDHVVYSGLEINLEKSCVITSKYHHVQPNNLKKIYEHGFEHVVQPEIPSDHSPVLVIFK